jgi:hypothetical protein
MLLPQPCDTCPAVFVRGRAGAALPVTLVIGPEGHPPGWHGIHRRGWGPGSCRLTTREMAPVWPCAGGGVKPAARAGRRVALRGQRVLEARLPCAAAQAGEAGRCWARAGVRKRCFGPGTYRGTAS